MVNENLVLTETEFVLFQRFSRDKGFDLSYFGLDISGSKKYIESQHFDVPKVIKIKRQRFDYAGVPYDVAEWQSEKWNATFSQLRLEFLNQQKGNLPAQNIFNLIKRRKRWADSWAFFRLAATSMSAGVLLALVPSSGVFLQIVSLALFVVSLFFLLSEWSRFGGDNRWKKIRDEILMWGDLLTPIFIMVSIASVIFNWAKIMSLIYEAAEKSSSHSVTCVDRFYSQVLPYWIIFFVFTLMASVLRKEIIILKDLSLKRKLREVGLMVTLTATVIAAYLLELTNSIGADLKQFLVFSMIFAIMLISYYLFRNKRE